MPTYEVTAPDGNRYRVTAPEGATQDQIIQYVQSQVGRQAITAPPAPQPEQSGVLRQILDVPLQVVRGGVGGIRMLADLFGAGSSASEALKSADTWLADLLSSQAKNDQRRIAEILKEAEDKGVLAQVGAGLRALATAPVDTLAQALGSTAPVIIAGLASGPVGAALGVARAGAVAMPAVGAAMGVGEVKGSIYEAVEQAYKEKGASDEIARAKALEAQSYASSNLPSMVAAGGLGAIAGGMGIERPLASMLSRGAVKDVAEQQALRDAERGLLSRVGLGALREGAPEFAQAGQSQLAQNIALRSEGFDVPLFRNVFGAGAMEGAAGAILGGGLAVPRTGVERLPGQQEGESDAAFARRMSREIDAARRAEQPVAPVAQPVAPTGPVVSTAPEGEDVFRLPDGSVGTLDQVRAYAMNLPPEQRASTLQSILAQRVPREKTVPPDLFTQPAEKPAEQAAEGAAPTKPVVAEKPAEEAKPEVVEPVKPPAVAMTKEEEEAALDQAEAKTKPEQYALEGPPIVEVPVSQLTLSEDVAQFKSGANAKGVVEPLEGKFDRRGVAPIQVWKRLDGRMEVFSGRHRLDLVQRSGEATIPAQIYDEATGFDAKQATMLDAELNIRDQQGKVKDYVAYFENAEISEAEANARGLLARAPGKQGFAIATKGSPELVAAHRADVIPDAGAAAIANAAPGDSRLQAVGIKAIQEGKSPLAAVNIIKAVQEISKGRPAPEGGDLFGFDDSAMKEAEEMAKIATLKQNQIAQRLAAISGASRRPEIAKKEGIDIKDPEALKKREKELRQQKASWDNWSSSPDLVQEIRKEMEPAEKPEEKPSVREAEPKKLPKDVEAKIDALGKALQRILTRYGLKDVGLRLVADMKAEGEYASKVLSLALDATDPVVALRHEAIHAMKELGFFSPAQWKSLERQAKEKWVDQYLKKKNVNRQPLQEGQLSRYDAYMKFYGGDQEAILEEAIADAFADFSATKAPPGMLQALLKRIQNFFQAIKEAFGAEPDAERIFKKAERGELRGKEVAAPEVAEAEEVKPSLRQVPLSTRGIMESSPVYAMDELGLKTTSEKKPGGIELFNDVRSIARALNNDTISREGAIKEKDYSIASALKLARAMADEISFQVGATAKTGTGLGWYSSNYPKSVKKLAKRFPELETDPYARTVFSALVAITSNGEKVATNVKNAINLYADIREGKAVVQPGSRRASAMENNLSTLKMLMDKFGPDLRAELMREITVKEMNAALRTAGEKPDTSYLADTKVPASAIYFGPKLGAFFSNLEGAEGYLTMDLWWTRTMNRMRGLLMPKATAASINKFRDLMDRPNATREEVVSATIPLRNKYEEFGFKTELEHLVGSKEPSSKSPDLPKWNRRARALAGPAYQQLVFEHRLEKLANTIHKNEFEMLEEAPFTASDRKFMYRTAREAQGMLRDNGIDLSLADIQAALWYYEKRLYQHLSGRKADDIGYDEAIEQLAGQSSGPAGPALVFNRRPAGGPGAAGAGAEADRLGGAGQAAKPSLRDKLGLYSELESKVSQGPGKGTAEAWKGYINGLTQKGVKPEEIEWSGVRDWLDLQKGSVTKEDLLAYLKNGGVQVEETVLRDSGDDIPFLDSAAKYSKYTLPGGENYREVLLTLPSRVDEKTQRLLDEERYLVLSAEEQAKVDAAKKKAGVAYRSTHWDQPNVLAHIRVNDRTDAEGNKVLFVEEIQSDWGQEGKKKGFIAGDWRESFKEWKRGLRERAKLFYLDAADTEEERATAIRMGERLAAREDIDSIAKVMGERRQMEEAWDKAVALGNRIPAAPFVATRKFAVFKGGKEFTRTDKDGKEVKQRYDSMEAAEAAAKKVDGEARDLGLQANTEGWLNLALKRIMVMAGEGGYDKVAFVNGDQSAERYDLSKQVRELFVDQIDDEEWSVRAFAKEGDEDRSIDKDITSLSELDDLVGKEVADRARIQIEQEGRARLRGLDLKVGGEGMKTFYDTIVPTAVKKLLPKVGGGRIEAVNINSEFNVFQIDDGLWGTNMDDRTFPSERAAREAAGAPQPGFDVTPAMKERVRTTGLPRFSLRDTVGTYTDAEIDQAVQNGFNARSAKDLRSQNELFQALPSETTDAIKGYWRAQAAANASREEGDLRSQQGPLKAAETKAWKKARDAVAVVDPSVLEDPAKLYPYMTNFGSDLDEYLEPVEAAQRRLAPDLEQAGVTPEVIPLFLKYKNADKAVGGDPYLVGRGAKAAKTRALNALYEALGGVDQSRVPLYRLNMAYDMRGESGLYAEETKPDIKASLRDTVNVDGTERPTTSSTNKPIYPTEEGTKNFWRWFKDSAVVDGEGRPLVVYHGTAADFSEFMRRPPQKAIDGLDSIGSWFTDNRARAQDYGPVTMPSYLSLQKPLVLDSFQQLRDLWKDSQPTRGPAAKAHKANRHWGSSDAFLDEMYGLYDGIIIKKHGNAEWKDQNAYIAFRPEQIKSAIGNVGKFDPVDPSIKASLRNVIDPAIRARIDQTTTPREEKTFIKRITDAIAPKSASSFRAAFLDRYNRLSEYDKELARQMGGAPLLADASSHSAALMSDLSAGVLAGAMGVHDGVGGIPVYVNGYTKIVNNNNTVKGPIAIFAPLAKLGDPTAYQAYQFWAGVKRGTRFDREGREQLFEKADIQKADDLRKQFLAMGVDFEAIQKEWIKFNDGLVQYLKDTGVLSDAAAKEFVKYSDYIPFYRQADGEETVGPQIFASLSGVRAPKKLKGSETPIAEFLETVVRNVQYSIEAGMKNVAAQRAVNTAVAIGQANRLNYVSSAPNVVKVLENGKTSYYETKDMLFVEAMKSLNLGDLPFIGLLAGPANLLRNLVTKDPAFMLANMMRDSMSAWVSSGVKMTPMVDTLTNFTKALRGQNPEYAALLNSGVIGGYDYSQGVEISAQRFDRALRKEAGVYTPAEQLARPFVSLWDALEKGTTASDAATRMEVYKKTLAATGNEAEALFRAVEVMNFNRKGNNPMVRVLTAAVPFLNARMQGLDVLYRAAFGKGTEANAKEIQKSFFIRGMTIAALSTMYWMLASEDDEWKRQEQETRDNYWILGDVKIPIPFEIGVLFKVIPERILEYSFGDDTGKDFLKSMTRQLTSTLSFNPIPQTALPLIESVTNYSFFTGRPIVSQGLEDVNPAYQIAPGTSRIGELIGGATKGLPTALQLSPVKIDEMIRGYTGTIGGYMMDLFDAIYDMNTDAPKAAKRFEQMPVIRRFAVDPLARGQVTAYYELKNSVDEAVRTANLLERNMKPQEWGEFMQENMGLLATKDYVLDLEKSMKQYREMKNFVRASTMDAEGKKDIIANITELENNLASNIQEIKKMIDAQ